MLYDSTKTLLRTIVRSLEMTGKFEWDDQVELSKECLYEMHQMTRPSYRAYRTNGGDVLRPTQVPAPERLTRALPHVKVMVSAIRRKDQVTALVSGKAALAEM